MACMRDYISHLFLFATYREFWTWRKVCKVWWQQSKKSQANWYHWLETYAPKRTAGSRGLAPVILKTVPLHHQVMDLALKKARKRQAKRLAKFVEETSRAERTIVSNRRWIGIVSSELRLIERVQEQYPERRKRTRIEINISNP